MTSHHSNFSHFIHRNTTKMLQHVHTHSKKKKHHDDKVSLCCGGFDRLRNDVVERVEKNRENEVSDPRVLGSNGANAATTNKRKGMKSRDLI